MRAGWRWRLALAALLVGCHRTAMPPRPDGAAVVITAETQDDGVVTVPEVEPNNTLPTAQLLAVTATTPAAVAGALGAQPPAGKRDVDLYRVDVPGPDGGVAPPAGDAGAAASPPRFLLRADLRPAAPGLAATLEVLDAAGHVLVAANGQPGEALAIPNLAARGGSFYLRVRAAGGDAGHETMSGAYRLVVRLGPFDAGAEIEPNGDAAHATELAPGGEAVGYLGWRHDQDWYRLPTAGLAEGSVLSVNLDPLPEVSVTLQLYGADAHKLTEARGRRGERVVLRNVRIAPTDSVRLRRGARRRRLQRRRALQPAPAHGVPKAGTEAEPNDDQAHAQPIGDGTVLGYLARGDVDFFRYSSDGMALLDLEVTPPERGGVEVEVTREDNTLLARACQRPARSRADRRPADPGGHRSDPRRAAATARSIRTIRIVSP